MLSFETGPGSRVIGSFSFFLLRVYGLRLCGVNCDEAVKGGAASKLAG
jgi:hypothetical protein